MTETRNNPAAGDGLAELMAAAPLYEGELVRLLGRETYARISRRQRDDVYMKLNIVRAWPAYRRACGLRRGNLDTGLRAFAAEIGQVFGRPLTARTLRRCCREQARSHNSGSADPGGGSVPAASHSPPQRTWRLLRALHGAAGGALHENTR